MMAADNFKAMTENNNALRHVPVGTVFRSDGVPPHFPRRVRAFPNRKIPDSSEGRAEPIPWQSRSPDLTPFGYFSSGGL